MRPSSLAGAFIISLHVATALTPVYAADMTNERMLNASLLLLDLPAVRRKSGTAVWVLLLALTALLVLLRLPCSGKRTRHTARSMTLPSFSSDHFPDHANGSGRSLFREGAVEPHRPSQMPWLAGGSS
jgi:hypothetical protein